MSRKLLMIPAAILLILAIDPALARQNNGSNWPSRSCGCSTGGKCYIAHKNDGSSQCLPDSSGGNACSGVCSFTNNPAGSFGGSIMMMPQYFSAPKGGGSLFAK